MVMYKLCLSAPLNLLVLLCLRLYVPPSKCPNLLSFWSVFHLGVAVAVPQACCSLWRSQHRHFWLNSPVHQVTLLFSTSPFLTTDLSFSPLTGRSLTCPSKPSLDVFLRTLTPVHSIRTLFLWPGPHSICSMTLMTRFWLSTRYSVVSSTAMLWWRSCMWRKTVHRGSPGPSERRWIRRTNFLEDSLVLDHHRLGMCINVRGI